jgi:exosome complex component CSL4
MVVADGTTVVPGQRLAQISVCASGDGTYVRGGQVFASIVGKFLRAPAEEAAEATEAPDRRPVCTVQRVRQTNSAVPRAGDTVTGRVLSVNPRFAKVEILCLGSEALGASFSGIIRKVDVRQAEVDQVEIYKSFRPGDIVRAAVISLGDKRSYYLSTAQVHLGVILATSQAGARLEPISWQEMRCALTKQTELRKVAKRGA